MPYRVDRLAAWDGEIDKQLLRKEMRVRKSVPYVLRDLTHPIWFSYD